MSALTYKKNDDLDYGSLDKMTVFQECLSGFNASPIQPKKCRALLTKLVRLINTGEVFPAEEATTLFFCISKLFQHKDPSLRQMVYIAIKELSSTANDVIMVTSSIMKDIQSSADAIYKPNAIRALVRIIDSSTLPSIERLMRSAITDKHASVITAALVSSYHLTALSQDVVRRWASETQEALQKHSNDNFKYITASNGATIVASRMFQYHAIGLLYKLRSHDKVALMRLIQHVTSKDSPLENRNALLMVVKIMAKLMDEDPKLVEPLTTILTSFLKGQSDMVGLEAAKTILNINPPLNHSVIDSALERVTACLGSPRTVEKFAAVRILNKYALEHPGIASRCNSQLEGLIGDSSRAIATYAITILLKTGNEHNVDTLVSKITSFMNEISDEFKIIVMDAIRNLALKFPNKHQNLLAFLAGGLRDDGGLPYKTTVVEALFDMIRNIPAAKDAALGHLAELVEDCEFPELCVRILHILGAEGPTTSHPTKYIRYIYNRVVLENAVIRAAAVVALSKFALVDDPKVHKSIKVLLTRCLDDVSDEVRDRAALALRFIELDTEEATEYIAPKAVYSVSQFENALTQYLSSGDKSVFLQPFDVSIIARVSIDEARSELLEQRTQVLLGDTPKAATEAAEEKQRLKSQIINDKTAEYAAAIAAIPDFQSYGPLLKSSESIALTESEMEYVVTAVKHVFRQHIVVQYNVTNTFNGCVLENVQVDIPECPDVEFVIPIETLVADTTGTVYVSITRPEEYVVDSYYNVLKFVYKEVDPSTNEPQDEGFDDEYNLENLDITAGDYLIPTYAGNFAHLWDELSHEAVSTYQLGFDFGTAGGATYCVNRLSMMPIDGTSKVESTASHTLKLFAKTIDGQKVAAQIKLVYSSKNGLAAKIVVHGENQSIAELVADSLGSA